MNENEISRIAAAVSDLRPDWPAASLRTILHLPELRNRPRRDVAVALVWVACEADTKTPRRVLEAGPWWRAAAADGATTNRDNPPRHLRCSVCSLSKDRCEQVWANDHDFEPVTDRKLPPEQINAVVTELKGHLEPMKTPAAPREALHGRRTERPGAARVALHDTDTDT